MITEDSFLAQFIVWDVGQGSWSTFIESETCHHFDMGGEKWDRKKISRFCSSKKNAIYLTHLDHDHINFVKAFTESFESCLFYPKKVHLVWNDIEVCTSIPPFIEMISTGSKTKTNSNAQSVVYLLHRQILISGDAPKGEEKKWAHRLPSQLKVYLAGHHGSDTSTSDQLLKQSRPQWVIISARQNKYGHPHKNVLQRLIKQKIPYLKTEDFGNIYFNLNR